MYYYTYYSYEQWGRGYIGSRQSKVPPEKDTKYMGSFCDKTFKPTHKIILQTYETREEALADEILLHQFFQVVSNPHFANRSYQTSTKFILEGEQASKIARQKWGKLSPKERGEIIRKGRAAMTQEQRSEIAKKIWNKISPEKRSEIARKGGIKCGNIHKENGTGIFSLTEEQKKQRSIKGGKAAGNKNKELGIGLFAMSKEQKQNAARKGGEAVRNQKWQCLITGYVSNAPGLSVYQRARGIDTSKRIRLS